jgi:hypothetical protein
MNVLRKPYLKSTVVIEAVLTRASSSRPASLSRALMRLVPPAGLAPGLSLG